MIEGRPPRDRSAQGATTTSPQARKAVQEDIVNYQIKLDAVEQTNVGIDELTEPLTFPVEAYLRSEEHTSELQSLMRTTYAVFCLKKKNYTYFMVNSQSTISSM